jgi:hypothetical protein
MAKVSCSRIKFDEAFNRCNEAIRLDPKSGEFYLGRQRLGDTERAIVE